MATATKGKPVVDGEDELVYLRRQNSTLKGLIKRALRESLKLVDLPSELRDSKDFVLAAVNAKTANWYDLPPKWKDDAEIACAVFERERMLLPRKVGQYPNRLRSVDYELVVKWLDLPHHLKMNKEVLLYALRSMYGPRWEEIPIQYQSDINLLSTAVLFGKISFEDVPHDLQRNHPEIAFKGVQFNKIQAEECTCFDSDFFKQVIEDGRLNWEQLPLALQGDVNFALSISRFTDTASPGQMLHEVPQLRHDPSFWRKLLYSADLGEKFRPYLFNHLMVEYAPADLRMDHDFMLEMCQESTEAFSVVDRSLSNDRNFLESVLAQNAAILKFISHETQQQHRDLVIMAIPNLGKLPSRGRDQPSTEIYYAAEAMCPSFWMEYDFAMTWMKAGHGFPNGNISHEVLLAWRDDRGLCLASALHSKSLYFVGPQFKGEAAFVKEVVEHHPELYSEAIGAAKSDPAVMVTAFAGSSALVASTMMTLHLQGHDDEIQSILDFIRSKLDAFEVFYECILGNMLSTQSVEVTGTNLTLLNQGLETSKKYKRLLAEYLDIPTGKWLCYLKQAEQNIHKATAPWTLNV